MVDLELVSTDDLIDEVFRRADHGIIGLLQVGTHGDESFTCWRRWKGNSHTCMGLATDATGAIMASLRDCEEPDDEEDEDD